MSLRCEMGKDICSSDVPVLTSAQVNHVCLGRRKPGWPLEGLSLLADQMSLCLFLRLKSGGLPGRGTEVCSLLFLSQLPSHTELLRASWCPCSVPGAALSVFMCLNDRGSHQLNV